MLKKKSLKEVKYHYTHTETWMRILLKELKKAEKRIEAALENLWEYTGGLFDEVEEEENLVALNLIPASKQLHEEWKAKIAEDFAKFGLEVPTSEFMQKRQQKRNSTEYFGYILCELQYMQRTYPNCVW